MLVEVSSALSRLELSLSIPCICAQNSGSLSNSFTLNSFSYYPVNQISLVLVLPARRMGFTSECQWFSHLFSSEFDWGLPQSKNGTYMRVHMHTHDCTHRHVHLPVLTCMCIHAHTHILSQVHEHKYTHMVSLGTKHPCCCHLPVLVSSCYRCYGLLLSAF